MESDSTIWVIIGVVILLLVFVVVIVGVGLAIFFISRKRKKAQLAAASGASPAAFDVATSPQPEIAPPDLMGSPALESPTPAYESAPAGFDSPAAIDESPLPSSPEPGAFVPAPELEPASDSGSLDFDPSKTVAITREKTVTISYGTINFTSGVLAGQQFEVKPEGAYIGREASLSQIVVSDPRISKRHLWIGVRDGVVKIVDQDSRNGTFVNDPKAERVTEATLNSGDTVILGESDVARFEYHS